MGRCYTKCEWLLYAEKEVSHDDEVQSLVSQYRIFTSPPWWRSWIINTPSRDLGVKGKDEPAFSWKCLLSKAFLLKSLEEACLIQESIHKAANLNKSCKRVRYTRDRSRILGRGVTALGAACKKHTRAKLERYLFKLVFSKLYQILFYIKCKLVQELASEVIVHVILQLHAHIS